MHLIPKWHECAHNYSQINIILCTWPPNLRLNRYTKNTRNINTFVFSTIVVRHFDLYNIMQKWKHKGDRSAITRNKDLRGEFHDRSSKLIFFKVANSPTMWRFEGEERMINLLLHWRIKGSVLNTCNYWVVSLLIKLICIWGCFDGYLRCYRQIRSWFICLFSE